MRRSVQQLAHAEAAQVRFALCDGRLDRQPAQSRPAADQLQRRRASGKLRRFGHEAHPAADVRNVGANAEHPGLAGIGRDEPEHHLDQGRLSGAVPAGKAVTFAARDPQADAPKRGSGLDQTVRLLDAQELDRGDGGAGLRSRPGSAFISAREGFHCGAQTPLCGLRR